MNDQGRDAAYKTVERVFNDARSHFYATYFADRGVVACPENFESVPLLTRDELARYSYAERLYIEARDVHALRPTSGTTGQGILVFPRLVWAREEIPHFLNLIDTFPGSRLASFSGAQFLYSNFVFGQSHFSSSIGLDPGDMKASSELVAEYKPSVITGSAHTLLVLAEMLSEEVRAGVSALLLFGEWSSDTQRNMLRQKFPQARCAIEYASVDAQMTVALSCAETVGHGTEYVHPLPESFFVELIDESGGSISEPGQQGEVVITTVKADAAFPLVRYKTGDMVRIVAHTCPCGIGTPLLALEGRKDTDRVRIPGGEIALREVERALNVIYRGAPPREYELTVELTHRVELVLAVPQEYYFPYIPSAFSDELRVNTHERYSDICAQGKGGQPRITVLAAPSRVGKLQRIRRI